MGSGVAKIDVQRMKRIIRMIGIGEMMIVNDAGRVLCKETVDKQGDWKRGGAD